MGRIRSSNSEAAQPVQAYAIAPEVDRVLANWGQWAAVRVGVRRQAQGVFRLAGRGTRSAPTVGPMVNVDEAWRAEKTVCNPNFSPRFRAVLTAHYVSRSTKAIICRDLCIHWAGYDHELWRAATFFWNRYLVVSAA